MATARVEILLYGLAPSDQDDNVHGGSHGQRGLSATLPAQSG